MPAALHRIIALLKKEEEKRFTSHIMTDYCIPLNDTSHRVHPHLSNRAIITPRTLPARGSKWLLKSFSMVYTGAIILHYYCNNLKHVPRLLVKPLFRQLGIKLRMSILLWKAFLYYARLTLERCTIDPLKERKKKKKGTWDE